MKYRALTQLLASGGTNLTTVLIELRRDIAIEQLAKPDACISEIAAELGYSDATSFTRAFKKWTGTPPTRYHHPKH